MEVLTGGLGGMVARWPLAATMAGASMLAVECDETRIDFRMRTRYVDAKAQSLDEALHIIEVAHQKGRRSRLGCSAMRPMFPEIARARKTGDRKARPGRRHRSNLRAHDPLNGYLPKGWTLDQAHVRCA